VLVELRRALLLFAIVLGLAAVVATLSSPTSPSRTDTAPIVSPTQTARPGPRGARTRTLAFNAGRAPVTKTLDAGHAATVVVKVDEPGTVVLRGLGLTAPAEPLTPARFDLLSGSAGRHQVELIAANGVRGRTVGVIVIRREG
jgi:hypothetical protein